ncbi:hypothetical protein D1007_14528 [Hordeum vulgare]|nr:hypothetical protein D1007_14528 [Hordeum vulgare]
MGLSSYNSSACSAPGAEPLALTSIIGTAVAPCLVHLGGRRGTQQAGLACRRASPEWCSSPWYASLPDRRILSFFRILKRAYLLQDVGVHITLRKLQRLHSERSTMPSTPEPRSQG